MSGFIHPFSICALGNFHFVNLSETCLHAHYKNVWNAYSFWLLCCFLIKIFRARAEWILPNPTTSQRMPRKGSLTNKHGERPRAKKPTSSRESLLFKASSCVVKAFCEAFSDSTSAFVVCSPLPRSATVWSAHKHVMLLLAAGLR